MRTKEYRRNEVELSKARIALKNANDDCERENAIARIRQLEKERVNIPQVTLWITIMQGWSMSDMLMIGCAELSVRKRIVRK